MIDATFKRNVLDSEAVKLVSITIEKKNRVLGADYQ